MNVVIVGNGIAGNETAFTLRALDENTGITILSAEKFPEYDPCSLPYFLAGDVERESVFRKTREDYKNENIHLVLDHRVVSIDPDAKKIHTEKGKRIPYDKLVLAHGGSLVIPPIKGIEKKGILGFKQLEEADRLARHRGRTAVVIGAGPIGVEVAEALKKKGYEVTIIELLDWILSTLFDEPAGRRLEKALKDSGVSVLTGEKVLKIEGNSRVTGVVTDRRQLPADTVVIATGMVPGNALAETAGIEVGMGIKVNEKMETRVEDIYACGDCVEIVDACTGEYGMYQLKHNAIEQARIVARNILGEDAAYPGAYLFARAHFFDTHAATVGMTMGTVCNIGYAEIIERESGESYLRVLLKDGKITGAQAIGTYADYIGLFLSAMWRQDDINLLRQDWEKICRPGSPYPWTHRKIGHLLGL